METIIASVLPQVTTTWSSGSRGIPMKRLCLRAKASRNPALPQVTAYWCGPWDAVRAKASFKLWGGSKSGNP